MKIDELDDEELTEEEREILSYVREEWMLPWDDWGLSLYHEFGELCRLIDRKRGYGQVKEAAKRYFSLCWGYLREVLGEKDIDILTRSFSFRKVTRIKDINAYVVRLGGNLSRMLFEENARAASVAGSALLFRVWEWIRLGLPKLADREDSPEGDE